MNYSFESRAKICTAPIAKRLFELMATKQSNIALSADVTTSDALLTLADQLGPEICLLKTHIDILSDFTPALIPQLKLLSHRHQFLIFEDRKFADIGHTVRHQFAGGLYRIADWADMINAHTLPGPGIIDGLQSAANEKKSGLILLAEMSSQGHLMNETYKQATLKMAEQYPDYVIGFVTQHALSQNPRWIHFTPGVKLTPGTDSLGQQYITPEHAILKQGSDILIVGRGILESEDRIMSAQTYRKTAWQAYQKRLSV